MTQPDNPSSVLHDENAAREIIAEQFPDLRLERVALIAESDFRTFEVDDAFIFRFPKLPGAPAKLEREIALLPALSRVVPLAVPIFEYVGLPSGRYPYPFAGYRKIDGVPGEDLRPVREQWSALAKQLGGFLSRLHNYPAEMATKHGVPTETLVSPEALLDQVAQYESIVRKAVPVSVRARAETYLTGRSPVPPAVPSPAVLSPADLKGEHLILSSGGDSLAGIVDWADMCLTDPVLDFTGLMIWLGEPLVRQVLNHYEPPADDGFLERVCFFSRCFTLRNLGERLAGESDAPLDLLLTQLRWAFLG